MNLKFGELQNQIENVPELKNKAPNYQSRLTKKVEKHNSSHSLQFLSRGSATEIYQIRHLNISFQQKNP
jgi:hypothetical protein